MGIIRLLLAIAVFNSHYFLLDLPIVDGHEAVLTFFAISGFYMALILDGTYITRRDFYLGRLVSLYPMYAFALGVSIALLMTLDIHPMTTKEEFQATIEDPLTFAVMTWTTACTVGQELLFSLTQATDGKLHFTALSRYAIWSNAPLIQAWSLSLEIIFYAMAPFLVGLKSRSLGALVAASLSLKIAIMLSPYADVVFFKRFFPCEFWLFGSGVLAYRLHCSLPEKSEIKDYLAFSFLVAFIFIADGLSEPIKPYALPATCLLALPFIFRGFKSLSFDKLIGKVSYPFYLLHFSVIALFETYWEEPQGWHMLSFTLAAAFLTHAIFNPGIELLKSKMRTPQEMTLLPEEVGIVKLKP